MDWTQLSLLELKALRLQIGAEIQRRREAREIGTGLLPNFSQWEQIEVDLDALPQRLARELVLISSLRIARLYTLGPETYVVLRNLLDLIAKSESPIESIMILALALTAPREQIDAPIGAYIIPQAKVTIKSCEYRVDCLIQKPHAAARVAVECDGHAFHEKTKEQAAHDKVRDRALAAVGYTVLHFTGSEIVADSFSCAEEA